MCLSYTSIYLYIHPFVHVNQVFDGDEGDHNADKKSAASSADESDGERQQEVQSPREATLTTTAGTDITNETTDSSQTTGNKVRLDSVNIE